MTLGLWRRARAGVSARITRSRARHACHSRIASPLVSFSFDDFPRSAAGEGLRILARYALRGTYFVSGARMGLKLDGVEQFRHCDLADVIDAGHEIGCHTFDHRRLSRMRADDIERDLARNRHFLESFGIAGPASFAYPYGDVSIQAKTLLMRHFRACRGIDVGINRGLIDFAQLKAVILTRRLSAARIGKILDAAQAWNGWVIFFTHDVSDEPFDYGCTPEQLADVAQQVAQRGLRVLPVGEAAEQIYASAEDLPAPEGDETQRDETRAGRP